MKSSIPAELNPDADRRRRKPRSDRRLEESFPVPTGGDGGFIPGAERCASQSQHSRRRRLVVLSGGRVEVQAAVAASIQAATALKLPIHYLLHLFLILSLLPLLPLPPVLPLPHSRPIKLVQLHRRLRKYNAALEKGGDGGRDGGGQLVCDDIDHEDGWCRGDGSGGKW